MNGEFWNVFTTSRNAMLLTDDERRYIAGNEAALSLLGLTAPELGRLRVDDLTPEDMRGGVEEMWSSFLANGSLHGHYTLVVPSGRRLEVEYSATANVLPGRHLSILLERDGGATVRETLTVREREVVRHIAEGATTQEIAQRLFISATTVDTHVRKAMLRLGAKNRAHLIALALQRGQI
jgi:PAS domain S-box-containing protein